jgi:colicin import membrane protein
MTYREEPGRLPAGILALLVHVLFFTLLVFGVTWQNREPAAVTVDLWDSLPAQPKAQPTPQPKPKRAEPERIKPPPKVVPEPRREVAKPDIALQKKDKQRQEKIRQEELQRQQQIQAEQIRQAEMQRQQQALQQQILAQQASMQARLVGEYKDRIMAKIKRFVIVPPDLAGNPQAEFDVVLLPGGDVLSVKLKRSSGLPAYDNSVERAIYKAQPLPLPPDPALFQDFRELHLKFRPNE